MVKKTRPVPVKLLMLLVGVAVLWHAAGVAAAYLAGHFDTHETDTLATIAYTALFVALEARWPDPKEDGQ